MVATKNNVKGHDIFFDEKMYTKNLCFKGNQ